MVLAPFVNYNMDAIFPFCAEAAQLSSLVITTIIVLLLQKNDFNINLTTSVCMSSKLSDSF